LPPRYDARTVTGKKIVNTMIQKISAGDESAGGDKEEEQAEQQRRE
jgi:hypothetical protein